MSEINSEVARLCGRLGNAKRLDLPADEIATIKAEIRRLRKAQAQIDYSRELERDIAKKSGMPYCSYRETPVPEDFDAINEKPDGAHRGRKRRRHEVD